MATGVTPGILSAAAIWKFKEFSSILQIPCSLYQLTVDGWTFCSFSVSSIDKLSLKEIALHECLAVAVPPERERKDSRAVIDYRRYRHPLVTSHFRDLARLFIYRMSVTTFDLKKAKKSMDTIARIMNKFVRLPRVYWRVWRRPQDARKLEASLGRYDEKWSRRWSISTNHGRSWRWDSSFGSMAIFFSNLWGFLQHRATIVKPRRAWLS